MSLFSEITLKYGRLNDVPRTLLLFNLGCKKPDLRSTDGSGWKNLGK